MTEIDPALVEKVARALARADGFDPDESWQEFDRNAHHSYAAIGETYDDPTIIRWTQYAGRAASAIHAINLPELLRKEREYDALLARVEAAPEVTVGESQFDFLVFVDTRTVELQVEPLIGKRVRLLAVEEPGNG